MNVGVIVFPGSNCDRDVAMVTQDLLGLPTRMVWHQEENIEDLDLVIIPGGFSYGDYLRCGSLARFSPAMTATMDHAKAGGLVLGICNGFQILTEAGLLPGALVRNRDLHFICDRVPLRVERINLPWTQAYRAGEVITLPVAHGEGCYYAEESTLAELERYHQVVFRYCTAAGDTGPEGNINGSLANIAGICNRRGNVLGLMPHPERASDPGLGLTDGLRLFKGTMEAIASKVNA